MTHEELLEKIRVFLVSTELQSIDENFLGIKMLRSLYSIVELHKPFMYDGRMGKYERCSFCTSEEEWLGEIYPCQTILTIENELK